MLLLLTVIAGAVIVHGDASSKEITETQIDRVMHENDVLRAEVARLQNELLKKKRFNEVGKFGEDNPGDTPEECKERHDNITYKRRRLAPTNARKFLVQAVWEIEIWNIAHILHKMSKLQFEEETLIFF